MLPPERKQGTLHLEDEGRTNMLYQNVKEVGFNSLFMNTIQQILPEKNSTRIF